MNQDSIQVGQVEANRRGRSKTTLFAVRVVAEIVLIGMLAVSAYLYLRWPPKEAANMAQNSAKYAVAAWNLYETGRYELTINNRGYPSWGGLGYGLLIVPSYWLFGPYLGNAIYTQTALSVLMCVLIYLSLRLCFGILPAVIAALVLPLYPDFSESARLNESDLPAAFFLVLGLLIFLWILRDTRSCSLKWLLWGLCAGWGTAVRTSNLPVFGALTVTLVWLSHRRVRETSGNLLAAVIGSLPLMVPLLWYNHHYCGSCFRDPHAFWESYDYGDLSQFFGLHYVFGSPSFDTENLNQSGNLIFYGREILSQFSRWPTFVADQEFLAHELTYFLSGVMVVGVVCVYRRGRSNPAARHLLWYAVVGSGTTLFAYLVTKVGNIRYIVPMIPFAAIFMATAVVDVARWLGRQRLLRVLIPVFLLMSGVTPYRSWKGGRLMKLGEWIPKAQVLEAVNTKIESNAVVLGFENWELINHFVIRGTARQFVPIKNKSYFRVQPKAPVRHPAAYLARPGYNDEQQSENGAVDIFNFSATEDPLRIQELLVHGVPVYAIDFSYDSSYNKETLLVLNKHFTVLRWQSSTIMRSPKKEWEGATYVVLWKIEPQTLPFLLQ